MNILITGGAGYVGGAVTDLLKDSGHNVRVYDALLYEASYRKDVDFVYGDIRDAKKLLPQLKWADAVVWLAAIVGDGACALNPEISQEVNCDTVQWLSENFDGRIIFMSTCSVYGAQDGLLDESSPKNPLSVYASTKLGAEKFLLKKNAIIFRLGTLFGVSDKYSRVRLDLVVNTMTVKAHTEGKIKVFGGDQFRPLLHVRDAAKAVVENLEKKDTGIFNLHTTNMKMLDLAHTVNEYFPKLELDIVDMKFEDSRNYRVKSDKARKQLGFNPTLTVDDGVQELKKLLVEHRLKDVNNPVYINQGYLQTFKTHHYFNGN